MLKIADLRKRLHNYICEAKAIQQQLDAIEQACNHLWSDTVLVEEKITEYRQKDIACSWVTIPSIEAVEVVVPTWSRTCSYCGKLEKTTVTEQVTTYVPRF